jgi:hypothetical protein
MTNVGRLEFTLRRREPLRCFFFLLFTGVSSSRDMFRYKAVKCIVKRIASNAMLAAAAAFLVFPIGRCDLIDLITTNRVLCE